MQTLIVRFCIATIRERFNASDNILVTVDWSKRFLVPVMIKIWAELSFQFALWNDISVKFSFWQCRQWHRCDGDVFRSGLVLPIGLLRSWRWPSSAFLILTINCTTLIIRYWLFSQNWWYQYLPFGWNLVPYELVPVPKAPLVTPSYWKSCSVAI